MFEKLELSKRTSGILSALILTVMVLGIVFLAVYNQPYYPRTWIDEGFALQGAMNLARFGQYAMRSSEAFRVFDQPLIANGPGVVLPVSLVFKLFGVGLTQARFTMAVFMVVTSLVFFGLAYRLYGKTAAIFSLLLLLALPEEGFVLYGRHSLGMVPSLLYFLIGYIFWLIALERKQLKHAFIAGLFFGVAMVTKGQYLLLIPMLFIVWIADWIFYKQALFKRIIFVLLAIAVVLSIWYGFQFIMLGPEGFAQSLRAIQSSSRMTITAFNFARIPGNLWYLVRSGILIVVLPGWLYVAKMCLNRDLKSTQQILLLIFVPVWLFWFAFVSVGFHRYALDPYMIGTLFTGKLVADVFYSIRSNSIPLTTKFSDKRTWLWVMIAIIGILLIAGAWGLTGQFRRVAAEPDKSPQIISAYLQENIPPQAVIESWEWELDVLTPDLIYHHPANIWVDRMHLPTQFGIPVEDIYDPSPFEPDYLINGPFSSWTGLYTDYLASGCCSLIKRIGSYELYEVDR